MPVTGPGIPFNEYTARMLADVENVRDLCATLEAVAGELPPGRGRGLDGKIERARAFMQALAIMPTMISVATPADVRRARTAAERGV